MTRKISMELKESVIKEYHSSDATVKQIAYKHGVGLRTIYQWIGSGHDRRRYDKPRISIWLTGEEAELLIKHISTDDSCIGRALYDKLVQRKDEYDEYLKAR